MEEHALSVLVLTFGPVPASLLAHHVDGETRLVQVRSREVRADEPVGGSVVVDWYGPAPAPHRLLCQVLRRMPYVLDGADGAGEYEFAWVQLTSGFAPQKIGANGTGTCSYGRNEARSEGPFGITVWGWGKDASYGYAGGMGARPINDAPLPVVQ